MELRFHWLVVLFYFVLLVCLRRTFTSSAFCSRTIPCYFESTFTFLNTQRLVLLLEIVDEDVSVQWICVSSLKILHYRTAFDDGWSHDNRTFPTEMGETSVESVQCYVFALLGFEIKWINCSYVFIFYHNEKQFWTKQPLLGYFCQLC